MKQVYVFYGILYVKYMTIKTISFKRKGSYLVFLLNRIPKSLKINRAKLLPVKFAVGKDAKKRDNCYG